MLENRQPREEKHLWQIEDNTPADDRKNMI